ncbi:MAG: recombination regulator RecX [Candidatus Accumulibacter sp.]|jgi:regulatory protein|nr:recombination regulator RecX [Accumulibacter sp.]
MTEPALREFALKLLARREHARVELERKLAARGASSEEIEAVLDDLAAGRLLSDERYAATRVRARGARYGNARLARELRAAGVEGELADSVLAGAGDELARAAGAWRRRYGSAGLPSDAAERARQTNFLMRRGFSDETIRRVLRGEHENE